MRRHRWMGSSTKNPKQSPDMNCMAAWSWEEIRVWWYDTIPGTTVPVHYNGSRVRGTSTSTTVPVVWNVIGIPMHNSIFDQQVECRASFISSFTLICTNGLYLVINKRRLRPCYVWMDIALFHKIEHMMVSDCTLCAHGKPKSFDFLSFSVCLATRVFSISQKEEDYASAKQQLAFVGMLIIGFCCWSSLSSAIFGGLIFLQKHDEQRRKK